MLALTFNYPLRSNVHEKTVSLLIYFYFWKLNFMFILCPWMKLPCPSALTSLSQSCIVSFNISKLIPLPLDWRPTELGLQDLSERRHTCVKFSIWWQPDCLRRIKFIRRCCRKEIRMDFSVARIHVCVCVRGQKTSFDGKKGAKNGGERHTHGLRFP